MVLVVVVVVVVVLPLLLLLVLLLLLLEVPSASSGPRMVPPKTTRSPRMPNFDCSRAELCCVLPG